MRRHWVIALVFTALVTLACKAEGGGGGDPDPPGDGRGLPSSMVALGDSLTAGFGSCLVLASCPRNSWSTGNGTQVNSHYRRILRDNPAIRGKGRNLARPAATVAALPGQADAAIDRKADYVTILIGANDACRGEMTPVGQFRDRIADFNRELGAACEDYGTRCRFDNIASFDFTLTMLSAIDFFHPNAAGQNALADRTYPGTFSW